MNFLLDTCALIALASGELPPAAHAALLDASQAIISPITPWELGIKVKIGKLQLPEPPLQWVQALAAKHQLHLPVSGLDAALLCAAADLPLIHRDPFDRVLIATALERNLILVTSDRTIPDYPGVRVIWH
jgi:PIN domain nuclease of toxin-antitoxin system